MALTGSKTVAEYPKDWVVPQWSAPSTVFAFVTTRLNGASCAPFDAFNLGLHVGDDSTHVHVNRDRLSQALPIQRPLQWLEQVHGNQIVDAIGDGVTRQADAAYVDGAGIAAAVMTADCLPVFFASKNGRRVAVAHAGWRGLLNGVLENTLARFPDDPSNVLVWFGPAIAQCHFEVGVEVRDAFLKGEVSSENRALISEHAFRPGETVGKYYADLYLLARLRLQACGVVTITGGTLCTYCDSQHFYSYRRDGRTGRFASVIGLVG